MHMIDNMLAYISEVKKNSETCSLYMLQTPQEDGRDGICGYARRIILYAMLSFARCPWPNRIGREVTLHRAGGVESGSNRVVRFGQIDPDLRRHALKRQIFHP